MIAIVLMTSIDMYAGINTDKLNVPSDFRVDSFLNLFIFKFSQHGPEEDGLLNLLAQILIGQQL
jgi:hypothetical protein